MTNRRAYGDHTITGLREWAKDLADAGYPIKGRSSMKGEELLAATKRMNLVMRIDQEHAVEKALGAIAPGTAFTMANCACILRATTRPVMTDYGTSYVYAEYVSVCEDCRPGATRSPENQAYEVRLMNDRAMLDGYRFFLAAMKPELPVGVEIETPGGSDAVPVVESTSDPLPSHARSIVDAIDEMGSQSDTVYCEWFAMCTNVATGEMPHPVLGSVAICERCRAEEYRETRGAGAMTFGLRTPEPGFLPGEPRSIAHNANARTGVYLGDLRDV